MPALSALVLLPVVTLVLARQPAGARPEYSALVEAAYPVKPGGVIAAAVKNCSLCHVKEGPPTRNVYGTAIKKLLTTEHTRILTSAILHRLDPLDSDGDGFTNLEEFQSDTLPGDPQSRPVEHRQAAPIPQANSAEVGLFSLQATLLARHAQHPVVVHFPIALFMVSLLFDLLGIWKVNRSLTAAASHNLLVAAVSAAGAVVTGLLAWRFAYGGVALKGNLLLHLVLGLCTTLLLWILWWVRRKDRARGLETPGRVYMGLSLIAVGLISLTGHIGGALAGLF